MAKPKSIPKLTLSASRDIPFNKLVLSQANVRQVKAGISIEELAEDIARRTLLQSLTVRAVLDEAGAETGIYEVPAGGRRFRALELLVKKKRLVPTAPIPCVIRTEGLAEEDSLAENIQRAPLHPLDQFRAFQTLREKGKSEEGIAAAFFVSVNVVRQRLKLAAVAPALLDLYADDAMTLEQLMAFTVNLDHQRQCEVWEALKKGYAREPYHIRRMLTEGAVRAGDKRARFVGEAYEAAGGVILRDLFADADDGWLQDAGLLGRLVAEKLEASANEIRGEAWKWVETAIDFPYGHTFGMRRLTGERTSLTEAEQANYDALKAEYDKLQEQHEGAEELPEEIDRRLGELETAIEAMDSRPFRFPPEEVARAGAFVSLDPSGQIRIERGYVRPEDERQPVIDDEETVEAHSAGAETLDSMPPDGADAQFSDDTNEEDDGDGRPLPDRLIADLTTFRTLALRDAVSLSPHFAKLAVLHEMALTIFYHQRIDSCLMIDIREGAASASRVEGLADFPPAHQYAERHAVFAASLPQESAQLWGALCAMDEAERDALFAHCAAFAVDAVIEPYNRRPRAIAHADDLAAALQLDMHAAGWRPTEANYFGRITKAHILDAVREAMGEEAAERITGMKKAEMAVAAEELLKESTWVPEVLRAAQPNDADGDCARDTHAPSTSMGVPAIPAIAAE